MATATGTPAALPAPAELPRPRTLLVGTAYATAATVMAFFTLFGIYFAERTSTKAAAAPAARNTAWIAKGTISLVPGGMMMMTLLMTAASLAGTYFLVKELKKSTDEAADITCAARQWAAAFEDVVRRYPAQWFVLRDVAKEQACAAS